MITASVNGLDALTARLGALPQTLAERLAAEVERLGGVVRDRVERNLSGAVLRQRSGRLAGSIAVDVERSGLGASATVSSDAPYAAIHEYGGTIPAHTILPQNARALAFIRARCAFLFHNCPAELQGFPKRSGQGRTCVECSHGILQGQSEGSNLKSGS